MPAIAKRKKTTDMPDSPPKRVTRARAKASNDDESKARTVKIMTSSTKAAMESKKPLETTKAMKRKTREDPAHRSMEKAAPEEVAKPQGKTKRAEEVIKEKADTVEAPKKTRGRQPKTGAVEKVKGEASKPRTRAKKANDAEVELKPKETGDENSGPAKKTARTRAATAITKPSTTSTLPRSSAPRKKVKFQEDAEKDKENMLIELEKDAPRATGLRAKPIRKPVTNKTSTRSRKAARPKAEPKVTSQDGISLPLSPKKVDQIAKSSSIGSEDELCGEKTPMRALSQSPVKRPSSTARLFDGVASKIDFSAATDPSLPTKAISSSILQSPARRPPPSPFKDALRQSPKKGIIGDSLAKPTLVASQSSKSTLRDSPKRGLAQPSLKPILGSQTPLKASLLQSPARRPYGSPVRNTAVKSPSKAPRLESREPAVTPPSSPQEACSSPLRAARTPGQPFKVHMINNTSGAPDHSKILDPIGQEVAASCTVKSPMTDKSPKRNHKNIEGNAIEERENGGQSSPKTVEEHIPVTTKEGTDDFKENRSTTPPIQVVLKAPAFSLASPAFRCSVEESDSEDELASPQKVSLNMPLLRDGVSMKDFGIQGAESSSHTKRRATPSSRANRRSIAMTPLAVQLSGWLASSPEKKVSVDAFELGQVSSSPAAMSVQESPPKMSFFEDGMAVLDNKGGNDLDLQMRDSECNLVPVQSSQESHTSEEYGDENEVPIDPQLGCLQNIAQDLTMTCTPAKVFYTQPREIHTVSKVPLRPAADDTPSPLKVPRKRSRSLAGPSCLATGFQRTQTSAGAGPAMKQRLLIPDDVLNQKSYSTPLKNRSGNDDSLIETPGTFRKNTTSNILNGAAVYVDVHTTEGEDASGIFLELLAQMGARCLKQWSWNPRASSVTAVNSPNDIENETVEAEYSSNKIGITHVVYKDGGKRTMEKVRASKGAVHCVGVGWVLE